MRAIVVTCPHCGARLKTDETLLQVVCEYCGTSSRLQRRTRMLERVMPPPSAPNLPAPVAVERRTFVFPIALLVGAIVVSSSVMAINSSRRRVRTPPVATGSAASIGAFPEQPPKPPPNPNWQAGGDPLLADIDGDGTVEILGRAKEADRIVIVAIDLGGTLRWKSEPIGSYDETYTGPLALAGDVLLFAGMRGDVRAIALADGSTRWTAKLDERTESLCGAGPLAIAIGTDHVRRALQLADGASAPAEPSTTCKPFPADLPPPTNNGATRVLAQKLGIGGFDHRIYDVASGGRILAGGRSKGTPVPTLVALDAKDNERWRVDVPLDPLGSGSRAPNNVVVGDDLVCATSRAAQSATDTLELGCFALADGRRIWTERLGSHYASAILMTPELLIISMWGHLEARDRKTGTVRWAFTEHPATNK